MQQANILWADDEIDLLKPHILFLTEKGYQIDTATNGRDALDIFKTKDFDIVFLDENMPGISGLDYWRHLQSGMGIVRLQPYT